MAVGTGNISLTEVVAVTGGTSLAQAAASAGFANPGTSLVSFKGFGDITISPSHQVFTSSAVSSFPFSVNSSEAWTAAITSTNAPMSHLYFSVMSGTAGQVTIYAFCAENLAAYDYNWTIVFTAPSSVETITITQTKDDSTGGGTGGDGGGILE